jgi:hypothetical protein
MEKTMLRQADAKSATSQCWPDGSSALASRFVGLKLRQMAQDFRVDGVQDWDERHGSDLEIGEVYDGSWWLLLTMIKQFVSSLYGYFHLLPYRYRIECMIGVVP